MLQPEIMFTAKITDEMGTVWGMYCSTCIATLGYHVAATLDWGREMYPHHLYWVEHFVSNGPLEI